MLRLAHDFPYGQTLMKPDSFPREDSPNGADERL